MSTQRGIQIQAPKDAQFVSTIPIPKLRPDYILIKTVAVALNPTDWKHIDNLASKGALVGCDYAGTVEEVGKDVKKQFKKGDRICGMCHGSDALQHENGAFAEYIVAKGDIQMHIPKNISFEEAATLGVGTVTVGQSLYQSLKLPLPTEPAKESFPILIYGGSTATGSLAIQFAKLSNLTVITTCSPSNFPYVQSLGAAAAFDYASPTTCAAQIRAYTNNNLKHAFDTISTPTSASLCAAALSSTTGCTYSSLLRLDFPRQDVGSKYTLAYTAVGEQKRMGETGPEIPARREDFVFAGAFGGLVERLLGEGRLVVHRPRVREGGLRGVLGGLQELREGKISGEKLVYRIAETA